jgi:hypothetical protein
VASAWMRHRHLGPSRRTWPDARHQLVLGNNLARTLGELDQNLERPASQPADLACLQELATHGIQAERSEGKHLTASWRIRLNKTSIIRETRVAFAFQPTAFRDAVCMTPGCQSVRLQEPPSLTHQLRSSRLRLILRAASVQPAPESRYTLTKARPKFADRPSATSGANAAPISQPRSEVNAAPVYR